MKTKLLFALLLISVIALTVTAQQTNKGKSNSQSSKEAKKGRQILSFAKPEQMFLLLEGKWIFADMTCAEPYTVKVSPDRTKIRFKYAKPETYSDGTVHNEFVYNVIEIGKYFIRAQIEVEKRLTDDGKVVVWDFMFLSADEFVWHRTDWKGLGSTPSVNRCKEEKQIALVNNFVP